MSNRKEKPGISRIPPPAISLRNVSLRRGDTWILRDITWQAPAGSCSAILGPNGSGKSTIARIIACHLWPTDGAISVLGEEFGRANLLKLRRSIRLVQASGPLEVAPDLTARQVILTGFFGTIGLYDPVTGAMTTEADRLLEQVGLSRLAEHAYATLSSGERVRCLIARALALRPRLLLLDEPTSGLDLLAREQVLATIEKMFQPASSSSPTVVLITHHVEELPPATSQILLLDRGGVAASGPPRDVLRSEVLSRVYQCPLIVRESNARYYVEVHPSAWDKLLDKPA